eukprot:m.14492 g.14492  ORF g.14492 m.14492 type:complete len:196 (+) comp7730_c0_seq1:210-797(+)
MVLDHKYKQAFAAISQRTDEGLFRLFCRNFNFTPVIFHAFQSIDAKGTRKPIYHTNVVMSVADDLAVVCKDAIDDPHEREALVAALSQEGRRDVVFISEKQTAQFAGNMLMLRRQCDQQLNRHNDDNSNDGNSDSTYTPLVLVMSATAYDCLEEDQLHMIQKHCSPLPINLKVIETLGGGSARCMIAEVFLPLNK